MNTPTKQKTIETLWEVWTYDVWGNAEDGYEVNDRRNVAREYPITLNVHTHNEGTEMQFDGAHPTDEDIAEALSLDLSKGSIETDGDDLTIYVEDSSDGFPYGELRCVSHESLSPIREIV